MSVSKDSGSLECGTTATWRAWEIPMSQLQDFFAEGRAERVAANIKSVGYK